MSLSPLTAARLSNLHVSTKIPASTTVSHGFTVTEVSSPPFGSYNQCFRTQNLLQWKGIRSVPVEGKTTHMSLFSFTDFVETERSLFKRAFSLLVAFTKRTMRLNSSPIQLLILGSNSCQHFGNECYMFVSFHTLH